MATYSFLCQGSEPAHEHTFEFKEPVDWKAVQVMLSLKDPRCEKHPIYDPEEHWSCYDD